MRVNLSKAIKPGMRRPISVTVDEPVDKRADGSFAEGGQVEGDSTITIRDTSTETQINAYVNGDGSLGSKVVSVTVDGHVGEGDVPLVLEIGFEVAHPDATAFGAVVEGTDEPIPAVPEGNG